VLTIGDALCHFIPVFGKGMSVTAEEAVILDRLLAEELPMKRLARDFSIQSTSETPWGVAVTDFVCPATCGTRPTDLAQYLQYGMALTKLTAQDPEVHQLTAEVSQLLKPQGVLRRAGRSLM